MLIRFVLLLLSALVGLFASGRAGFGGAGPFAALLLGFVVQMRWRKETYLNEDEVKLFAISLYNYLLQFYDVLNSVFIERISVQKF